MTRHNFSPTGIAIAVALALSSLSPAALAATTWTGDAHHFVLQDPNDPDSSVRVNDSNAWENSGNWSNGAPSSTEVVNIDRPYSGRHDVAQLDSTRTVGTLNIGTLNNGLGQLNVGGSGKLTVGDTFTLGTGLGSRGIATFNNGATLTTGGALVVGQSGSGTLTLKGGANTRSQGDTVIGLQRDGQGQLIVDSNSKLTSDKRLIVGAGGNGSLEIKNGSQVTNQETIVANSLGSNGNITVDGAGSLLKTLGDMTVGNGGNGSLLLTNGAQVQTAGNTVLGALKGANGSISVDNSTLSSEQALVVGGSGNGSLEIKNAGQVTNQDSLIANDLGSNGSVNIDGAGSLWKTLGDMVVGNAGNGSLKLTNGAQVQTGGNTVLGSRKGSTGSVSVDNSSLSSEQSLVVGGSGNGSLEISNAGQVTNQDSLIANDLGSNGSVNVDGAGSLWKTLGDMVVGNAGNGSLKLTNGAQVQTGGNTVLGSRKGSNATLSVDNSSLSSDQHLIVGDAGNATLDISNGGQVTSQDSVIAAGTGSNGNASVSGAGSLWQTIDGMTLGQNGAANLLLTDQGTLQVGNGTLRIAENLTSSGALYIGAASDNAADAKAAGHLQAQRVVFGQGQGLVQFNHSDRDYQFDAGFEGKGTVNHIAGQTQFNGDSSQFTGRLNLKGGDLLLNNKLAGEIHVEQNANLYIGAHNGTTGEVLSDIDNNGRVAFDRSNQYQYDHVISGTGSVEQLGTGTTVLTGENTYTGGTRISNGTLQLGAGEHGGDTGSILGDVQIDAPGSLVFNRANGYRFDGRLSGTGSLYKRGTGRTELTADSSTFTGKTQVENGILAVNGKLGGTLDVYDSATLAGNGQVGDVTLHRGATIAPGNSIGTLTVAGDLNQHSGSTFQAELLSTGANDRLIVKGQANLEDGSIIDAHKLDNARYQLDRRYWVLSADQGLNGRYQLTGDTWVSTFYNLVDNYDSHNAYLDVQQTRLFQEAAYTPNQYATATAAQSLKGAAVPALTPPVHNKLFEAIAYLPDDEQARDAFDQLSGEFHASARTALIQDSRLVRDAANSRLRASASSQATKAADNGPSTWITTLGNWSQIKGDTNASRLRSDTKGLLAGVDTAVGDDSRLGVMAGYSRSELKTSSRDSSSDNDNIHLGLYGGTALGSIDVRGGMAYTWSRIDAKRSVNFAGYGDHLKSSYDANTLQAFGELGRRFQLSPAVQLEPFANLAYVQVKSDGFKERGGPAALRAKRGSDEQTSTTLGLRASADKQLENGKQLTVFASAGWKHALDSDTPSNTYRFDGSDAFRVEGVALSRNSAVIETGVQARITRELSLGAGYSGQIGDGTKQHGVLLNASYRF